MGWRAKGRAVRRGNYIYKWQFSKTKDLKIARFIQELPRKNCPLFLPLARRLSFLRRVSLREREVVIVDEKLGVCLMSREESE